MPENRALKAFLSVRRAAVPLWCSAVVACVPLSGTYERVDAPDAVYFKSLCRGRFGPPSTVYFPFHGIYISFNFDYTTFGLHIPDGMTAQLSDNTIRMDGISKSGPIQRTVHFKAFPLDAIRNNYPLEFAVRAPYTSPDNLGPLEGRSVGDHYVYYMFMGVDDEQPDRWISLPIDLIEGTIELPAMTIDGKRFERQLLPFKQATYSGSGPIEC
jgi:hypothetical protein